MPDQGKFSMMGWSQTLQGLLPIITKGEHMTSGLFPFLLKAMSLYHQKYIQFIVVKISSITPKDIRLRENIDKNLMRLAYYLLKNKDIDKNFY